MPALCGPFNRRESVPRVSLAVRVKPNYPKGGRGNEGENERERETF